MLPETIVLWMLTYALHSTILLGSIWILSRCLGREFLPMQEALWKFALFAGLLTASFQVGLNFKPMAGSWTLFEANTHSLTQTVPSPEWVYANNAERVGRAQGKSASGLTTQINAESKTPPIVESPPSEPIEMSAIILGLWFFIGSGALLLLLGSYWNLHKTLRQRADITAGPLPLLLGKLLSGRHPMARIRLTQSSRIKVPLAKGFLRQEICLPETVMPKLTLQQQEAVLAHETAHLLHKDPLWLLIAHAVERFLFFQPLNRVARVALQQLAEYRCDDWAAARTGRPVELARCLTEVARWSSAKSAMLPAPGMASRKSELGARVHRLMERNNISDWRSNSWWAHGLFFALTALVALAAPGFSRDDSVLATAKVEHAKIAPTTVAPPLLTQPEPSPAPARSPQPQNAPNPVLAEIAATAPKEHVSAVLSPPPKASAAPSKEPRRPEPTPRAVVLSHSEEPSPDQSDVYPEHAPVVTNIEPERGASIPSPETAPRLSVGPKPAEAILDEDQIDEIEDMIDAEIDAYGEVFEAAVEAFEEALDTMEDRVDSRLDRMLLEWRAERIEAKIDRFADRVDEVLDQFDDEIDQIESRFENELDPFENGVKQWSEQEQNKLLSELRKTLNHWQTEYRAAIDNLRIEMKRYERKYGP